MMSRGAWNIVPNSQLTVRIDEDGGPRPRVYTNIATIRRLRLAANLKGRNHIVRRNRFLTRLLSGAFVIAVAAGGVLFIDGVSDATPSASARQVVATSIALTTSPASSVAQGNPVTLTAAVAPAAAAGTVQFKDGSADLDNPVTVSNGTASVSTSTSTLAVGSHSLTAVFTPTNPAAYNSSTSPAVTFVVTAPITAAATTTTLTVLPGSPMPQGVPMSLRATVVSDSAAGTVQFQDGTTTLGAPVPVVSGSANLITSMPTQGTRSVTAVFTPSNLAAYGPSTSPAVSLTVTGPVGGALLERLVLRVQLLVQSILGG